VKWELVERKEQVTKEICDEKNRIFEELRLQISNN